VGNKLDLIRTLVAGGGRRRPQLQIIPVSHQVKSLISTVIIKVAFIGTGTHVETAVAGVPSFYLQRHIH